MSLTRAKVIKSAGLLSVAAAGGAIALLGAWLAGGLGGETTTVRELYVNPQPAPANVAEGDAMSIRQIYAQDSPGVVQITAKILTQARDPFFGTPFGFPTEEKALGSGFVYSKDGYIITNYHVIQGAESKSIRVSFSNSDNLAAHVVGADKSTDVAVLKVKVKSRALTPLTLGNSDLVRVGDAAVAVGNPLGYGRTVTAGIISALQREIQSPNAQVIDHVIQTDAAINPGNSGGPLINTRGEVIGVNTQIATAGGEGNVGIGFAIPINTVKDVATQLIKSGTVEHPYLGVQVAAITPAFAQVFNLPVDRGLLVESVDENSGAATAGLKGGSAPVQLAGESYVVGGDIIVSVDGIPTDTATRFRDIVSSKKPGDTVTLEIYRGATKQSLDVQLGRLPATTPPSVG